MKIYFILPPNGNMPSVSVRALCLEGFEPSGKEFVYIHGPKQHANRIKRRIINLSHYFSKLLELSGRRETKCLYFIKPHSLLVLLISRYLFRFTIYIDVNDPLHLKEHLGRFSKVKFWFYMKVCNGAIFESEEYAKFNIENFEKIRVVEDTPQFELSYINFHNRKKKVIWFGSAETSKELIIYMDFFKKFKSEQIEIELLGVDDRVINVFRSEKIDFKFHKTYNHELLMDLLSDSLYSFVPMPDKPLYTLRGNLKVKFAMAAGCIVIASNINMHKRLIDHGKNGFLFSSDFDFYKVLEELNKTSSSGKAEIALSANLKIMNEYSRTKHAEKICEYLFEN
jgi:glycosyltransferase involved in cell wall biosynthesis